MGLEDHLYAAEVSDGLFGQFAIFTCVKAHTVDEIDSRMACSQFLAYLNPEPFIREQIAKWLSEQPVPQIINPGAVDFAAWRDYLVAHIARGQK